MFRVRMLIKDNKVVCCSQLCDKTCPNYNKCREYSIDVKRVMKRDERLSFNYIEKLMSHDSYVRHRGAIKQKGWGK